MEDHPKCNNTDKNKRQVILLLHQKENNEIKNQNSYDVHIPASWNVCLFAIG